MFSIFERGFKVTIFLKGLGVIKARETKDGIWDDNGVRYKRQPNGTYIVFPSEAEMAPQQLELKKLEPYHEMTLENGDTYRCQPDENGVFRPCLVTKAKPYTTLSPLRRSGYSKTTGSGIK